METNLRLSSESAQSSRADTADRGVPIASAPRSAPILKRIREDARHARRIRNDNIVREYLARRPFKEIAREFGLSVSGVDHILNKAGAFRREPERALADRIIAAVAARHGLTSNDLLSGSLGHDERAARVDAYSELVAAGFTNKATAKIFGRSPQTISHLLWKRRRRNA